MEKDANIMEDDESTEVKGPSDRKMAKGQTIRSFIMRNLIIFLTIIGVFLGFAIGFGIRVHRPSEDAIMWIGMPGEIFMRILTLTIVPLVVSSIITGTSSLDPKANGRIGAMAFGFFCAANMTGCILAIIMFYIFNPGAGVEIASDIDNNKVSAKLQTQDIAADLIRNLFPDNIATVCFSKAQTEYKEEEILPTNITQNATTVYRRTLTGSNGVNVLGLIVISTVLGLAAKKVGDVGKSFISFFYAATEIITYIFSWITWTSPIGVCSLIASALAQIDDISKILRNVGMHIAALTVLNIIMQLMLVPLVYFILFHKNPLYFMASMIRPIMTIFAPPAQSVAIPDMLYTVEQKHGVDRRISRFIVPLGVAISRSGSAPFICLSVLFMAQLGGMDPNGVQVLVVLLLAFTTSLGIPSIPSGSIVAIVIIISQFDLEPTNVGLLIAMEWYNDRIRSLNNGISTMLNCLFVNKFCQKTMKLLDSEHNAVADKDDIQIIVTAPENESQKKSANST